MKKCLLLVFQCLLVSKIEAAFPIYPAEIIGRDLSLPGFQKLGHVGITTAPNLFQDAYQVIEVIGFEAQPVIRLSTIADFKTKTSYWGSRYGISDRGTNALRILREANFQKDLGCATYTITASYNVNTGYYDAAGKAHATHCGFFRCDTFVNYLFHWGNYTLPTYSPPGEINTFTIPKMVFNSFPNGNGDGPLSFAPQSLIKTNNQASISINLVTAQQLADMSIEEFVAVVDVSEDKITNTGAKNIFKFSQDPIFNMEKRVFLMDKLGFVGSADIIPSLIELYDTLDDENHIEIKRQLIATTQNLYQRHFELNEDSQEKNLLQNFFRRMLDQKISATEKEIVIRGFISLSPEDVVISNIDKINANFISSDTDFHPRTILGLKIELLHKSPQLEKIAITDILNMLKRENSADLDGVFNAYIIDRFSHLGPNALDQDIKNQISAYLNSVKFKYQANLLESMEDGMTMFSYGTWLEASALVNSRSLEDAGKYIARYVLNLNPKEQESYIIGLSNSIYMKKAFKTEPILIDFKNKNKNIYLNTVGSLNSHEKASPIIPIFDRQSTSRVIKNLIC